jgi:hypothetical protein
MRRPSEILATLAAARAFDIAALRAKPGPQGTLQNPHLRPLYGVPG